MEWRQVLKIIGRELKCLLLFFFIQLRPAAPTDSSLKWRFFRKLLSTPELEIWEGKKKKLQQTRQREQTTGLNDFSFSLSRSCFFLRCVFFPVQAIRHYLCALRLTERVLVVADSRRTIINPRQNPPIVGSILFDLLVDFPLAFLPKCIYIFKSALEYNSLSLFFTSFGLAIINSPK